MSFSYHYRASKKFTTNYKVIINQEGPKANLLVINTRHYPTPILQALAMTVSCVTQVRCKLIQDRSGLNKIN